MRKFLPNNILYHTCLIGLYCALALIAGMIFKDRQQYPHQLSIISIFRNEDRFLKEWIDFHRAVGVEHFYLFNNASHDDYLTVLQPYIDKGIVELYDWPYLSHGIQQEWIDIQCAAFRKAIDLSKTQSKWVATIDTDEFLFPTQHENLVDFLKNYDDCTSIAINWQNFGTSNVKRVPKDTLMIEMLVHQSPVECEINTFAKSIFKPNAIKYCIQPHTMENHSWTYTVDADKNIFNWKFHLSHPILIDKIRINHYWSRDDDFFQETKVAQYKRWIGEHAAEASKKRNDLANQFVNIEILRFIPAMKNLPPLN